MKKNFLQLEYGQYLKDVIDQLMTNQIYFKILPGIGATTLEIQTKRWSIIIEPNVPVIKGKSNRKKEILGVYEGIDIGDIIIYLSNSKITNKKILVTPESFKKVVAACEYLSINIYNEFFLLFDECDRTMKDVNFRDGILNPMNDFFKFKQKAFISATAVIPSDPRFEEQNFELVYVNPRFNYSKNIEVITTNNVSLTIKDVIKEHRNKPICVFLNHIRAIKSVITDLNIKEKSYIFCSSEKISDLRRNGYTANEHVEDYKYGNFNFFTSRFNSAVDVNMTERPVVILATNLHFADHTMIDPRSEAVQIVGRFRNGVSKLYAITNIDTSIPTKTDEEAVSFLAGCEESYNVIKTLRNSTAEHSGSRETLDEALTLVSYSKFVNDDGSKNHYMYDNYLYEASIKRIFKSADNLNSAYHNQHFTPTFRSTLYRLSDAQYKIPVKGISISEQVKAVILAIKTAQEDSGNMMYMIDNRDIVLRELQKDHTHIYEAFHVLGEHELLKQGNSMTQIKEAVLQKKLLEQKSHFPFIAEMVRTFDNYSGYGDNIKSKLKSLIQKFQLDLKPDIKLLKGYFENVQRTSLDGNANVKIYKISNPKFNIK